MNTDTAGTALADTIESGAAVDAVETVIWRYDNCEEISHGMIADGFEGVTALRLLTAASERVTRAFDAPESFAAYSELTAAMGDLDAALAACRAVGGAR